MRTILSPKMEVALNKQINAELWSGYLYLSMSCDMLHKGYEGFANWFAVQAEEEFKHAMKMVDYINSVNGKVKLAPIAEVRQEWNSPKDAFEETLMHEKIVTEKIHELMDLAIELKDYTVQTMLTWFVNEQIEEEDNPRKILRELEILGNSGGGLLMLDKKLGKRE